MAKQPRLLTQAEQQRIGTIENELQVFLEKLPLDDDDKQFLNAHFQQLKEALVSAFKGCLKHDLATMNVQQLHDQLAVSKDTISSHLHRMFNKPIESASPHLMRIAVVYMKFVDAFEKSMHIEGEQQNTPRRT